MLRRFFTIAIGRANAGAAAHHRDRGHHVGRLARDVVRYEPPLLHAFNFVLRDAHGKSVNSALLDIDVDAPPES